MHSYQHNIKTFNNATRHLTRVERSLYRDLIELYYDTEQPLPADDFDRLARRVLAVSEEEKAALQYVLDEFFVKTGNVYSHDYCDETIEKFHTATTAKAKAGKASAEARKKKAASRKAGRSDKQEQDLTDDEQALNDSSTDEQRNPTNQKPETRNQLNKKNNKKRKLPSDFQLTELLSRRAVNYWREQGREDLNPVGQFDQFRAHHKAKGSTMMDWDAAWQTWYSNAVKFNPPARGQNDAKRNPTAAEKRADYASNLTDYEKAGF